MSLWKDVSFKSVCNVSVKLSSELFIMTERRRCHLPSSRFHFLWGTLRVSMEACGVWMQLFRFHSVEFWTLWICWEVQRFHEWWTEETLLLSEAFPSWCLVTQTVWLIKLNNLKLSCLSDILKFPSFLLSFCFWLCRLPAGFSRTCEISSWKKSFCRIEEPSGPSGPSAAGRLTSGPITAPPSMTRCCELSLDQMVYQVKAGEEKQTRRQTNSHQSVGIPLTPASSETQDRKPDFWFCSSVVRTAPSRAANVLFCFRRTEGAPPSSEKHFASFLMIQSEAIETERIAHREAGIPGHYGLQQEARGQPLSAPLNMNFLKFPWNQRLLISSFRNSQILFSP